MHTWQAPDGSRWNLDTEWGEVNGRNELVGVTLRSADSPKRAISSTLWRSFRVGAISSALQGMAEVGDLPEVRTIDTRRGRVIVGPDGSPVSAAVALAHVASIYNRAWRLGEDPTKAVADALALSRSAAAKRVRRSRDAGLLPPTTRGRAVG